MSAAMVTARTAARAQTFHVGMAIACLAIALIGFAPTYWRGLTTGTFRGGPLVHLHAMVFYGWMIFTVVQAALVAQGRVGHHRAVGLAGISLATVLIMSGMAVSIAGGVRAEDAGYGREARAFMVVSWSAMIVFATLVWMAIANVTRPDRHRRLILAATISMLGAPIARWFLVLFAPDTLNAGSVAAPPPVMVSLPRPCSAICCSSPCCSTIDARLGVSTPPPLKRPFVSQRRTFSSFPSRRPVPGTSWHAGSCSSAAD